MARRLCFCDKLGRVWKEQVFPDSGQLLTAMGYKAITTVIASTKAQAVLIGDGGDQNGSVIYSARHGGLQGNNISIGHVPGPVGANNKNRSLGVTRVANEVQVVYATDSAGNSVTPTSSQVVALISADNDVTNYISAVVGGDGSALVGTSGPAFLNGGIDNGDFMKILGKPPAVLRINTIDVE